MRDAFAKVFGAAAKRHFGIRELGRLGQRLVAGGQQLRLHHTNGTGRGQIGQISGTLMHRLGEVFRRQQLDQTHLRRLLRLNRTPGQQEV